MVFDFINPFSGVKTVLFLRFWTISGAKQSSLDGRLTGVPRSQKEKLFTSLLTNEDDLIVIDQHKLNSGITHV